MEPLSLSQNEDEGMSGVPPPVSGFQFSIRCRSRILPSGGPASETKSCHVAKLSHMSEASYLQPRSRVCLKAPEALGVLMLKYMCSPTSTQRMFWLYTMQLSSHGA